MTAVVDPDLALLEQWRSGDRRAGDRLVRRHFPGVRLYFLSRYPHEHEDLVQETFSRLSKARDAFKGASTFKTYLFRIARYVGFEHLRSKYKVEGDILPMSSSLVDLRGRRPSSLLAEQEEHRLLLDALPRLTLEQQELIDLYYWQRITAKEIAEIVEIPVSTVRGRIRLALKRLAKLHQELGQQVHGREVGEEELEQWLEALREELNRVNLAKA
ncbi:MAG: sigma-70 family RNA polymerase sigma factor [Nannocystaceae bacterium]